MLHDMVISFLETELPGTELTENEDILNYAILGALDQDVEDIDEEIIQENLSTYCTIFNDLPEDEQLHLVRRLLSQVSAHRQQPSASSSPQPHQQPTTSLIAACLNQIKIHSSSSSSSDFSSFSSEANTPTADEQQALHMLRELLPQHLAQPITVIPNDYLLYILRSNHNNRETTASWLLEQQQSCNTTTNNNNTTITSENGLVGKVEIWRHQLQEKELQAAIAKREKEETRKQIVQKYALQVVPDGGNQSKKITSSSGSSSTNKGLLPPPPIKIKNNSQQSSSSAAAAAAAAAAAKVRYREGVVVSRKNEKYIIEKIGEDWDGGSKGKVYTKGKRGKGFI